MTLEPFNLIGKTVKDCFMINDNQALRVEFTDGTMVIIQGFWYENSSGKIEMGHLTIKSSS